MKASKKSGGVSRDDPRSCARAPRRVALFGGSFNPPHMGHVFVVAHVLAVEDVDEIWLVPTHTHAFGKDLAPFPARLSMCRKVAEVFSSRARVSDVEGAIARAGGQSFTVDTLEHLREAHPMTTFSLVIGSDLVEQVDRWRRADRLRELARFIVIPREGYPIDGAGPAIPDVSSTLVRQRLERGESVKGLMPLSVAEECRENGWYDKASVP